MLYLSTTALAFRPTRSRSHETRRGPSFKTRRSDTPRRQYKVARTRIRRHNEDDVGFASFSRIRRYSKPILSALERSSLSPKQTPIAESGPGGGASGGENSTGQSLATVNLLPPKRPPQKNTNPQLRPPPRRRRSRHRCYPFRNQHRLPAFPGAILATQNEDRISFFLPQICRPRATMPPRKMMAQTARATSPPTSTPRSSPKGGTLRAVFPKEQRFLACAPRSPLSLRPAFRPPSFRAAKTNERKFDPCSHQGA